MMRLSPLQYSPLPRARGWCECDHGSSDVRIACLQIQARAHRGLQRLHTELGRKCISFEDSSLCQSEHQRLRLDQSPTENDIFYFGQMTCSDCARAGCLMIPLCSPCSGQFKLSVIMMLAPAPDGPELWKLF